MLSTNGLPAQDQDMRAGRIDIPSEDERWQIVMATMRKHGFAPDALIETLHSAQEAFGFLDETALQYVAHSLGVPLSRVYGVATFYHLFTLEEPTTHSCVVCTGTACYIRGGSEILAVAEKTAGVKYGQRTADGTVSIQIARCFGPCGLAPLVEFDSEAVGNAAPAEVVERIERWMNNDSK
jgi:bidirectional [NiFe] hydrogenase diaphorase subunit